MRANIQTFPVLTAAAGLTAVIWAAYDTAGAKPAQAALLGALCGVALYHASFGFTGGWRRLIRERRGAGFRAQLLLLALTIAVSYPLIAYGAQIGLPTGSWVFPIGLSSALGAFIFGFGMQLGGGCGSGVLFTVGGGSTRMVVTLIFFVVGSVLWVATNGAFQQWLAETAALVSLQEYRSIRGVSLIREWGAPGALAVTLAVLAILWAWSRRVETRAHGALETQAPGGGLLLGPWTKTQGAVALAVASILTFLLIGRPWGITSAFPLWGVKAAETIGVPIREWGVVPANSFQQSLFADVTGVMNFGLMLGALAAAGLAGKYAPTARLSFRDLWTAILGGLLMGYGARLAYGCNIGGFLGGVASASLHGWSWLLFGWIGSMLGVQARALIGMDPPADPPMRAAKTVGA